MYSRVTSLRKTISLLLADTVVTAMCRSFQRKTRLKGGLRERPAFAARSFECGVENLFLGGAIGSDGVAGTVRPAAGCGAQRRGKTPPVIARGRFAIGADFGTAAIDLALDASTSRGQGLLAL